MSFSELYVFPSWTPQHLRLEEEFGIESCYGVEVKFAVKFSRLTVNGTSAYLCSDEMKLLQSVNSSV